MGGPAEGQSLCECVVSDTEGFVAKDTFCRAMTSGKYICGLGGGGMCGGVSVCVWDVGGGEDG